MLSQFNYFKNREKWFISSNYYEVTIEAIDEILESLKGLTISFNDFNSLYRNYGEQLLQNLILICLGDEIKANEIYQILDT